MIPKVYEAAEVWRRYLLNQREFISPFDQHLIPLGFIDSHTVPELPPNINRYLGRSIGFDLVSSHDQTFIFTKLPFAVIIGVIQTLKPGEWVGTRLTPSGGVFGQSKKIGLPGGLLIYMNGQSKRMMDVIKPSLKLRSPLSTNPSRRTSSGPPTRARSRLCSTISISSVTTLSRGAPRPVLMGETVASQGLDLVIS